MDQLAIRRVIFTLGFQRIAAGSRLSSPNRRLKQGFPLPYKTFVPLLGSEDFCLGTGQILPHENFPQFKYPEGFSSGHSFVAYLHAISQSRFLGFLGPLIPLGTYSGGSNPRTTLGCLWNYPGTGME